MSKRAAESTYRPKGYGISPSLARARAPFRIQNAVTGFTLVGFAVSVWAYSIYAVKQENFDDIDFEALNTTVEEKAKRISLEDELKAKKKGVQGMAHEVDDRMAKAVSSLMSSTETVTTEATTAVMSKDKRGILFQIPGMSRFFLPGETSLVSHAPSVDQIGRVGDKTTDPSRRYV
ncbi:hypothetical protein FRB93_012423 [Tulasnella sp. JGI-2019a]|nr:hypothetical protein FRB93_012423 [Tulasnella sp. JGI-2019a]